MREELTHLKPNAAAFYAESRPATETRKGNEVHRRALCTKFKQTGTIFFRSNMLSMSKKLIST